MFEKMDLLDIVSISSKLKVLYVEDDEASRTQSLKLFNNYFKVIDIAHNGQEGFDRFKEYHEKTNDYYDLVITDIRMPIMDGITMCKEIYKLRI